MFVRSQTWIGTSRLDANCDELVCGDVRERLTRMEMSLLRYLIEKYPDWASDEELNRDVWGNSEMDASAVGRIKKMAAALRRKLGDPELIERLSARGWRLTELRVRRRPSRLAIVSCIGLLALTVGAASFSLSQWPVELEQSDAHDGIYDELERFRDEEGQRAFIAERLEKIEAELERGALTPERRCRLERDRLVVTARSLQIDTPADQEAFVTGMLLNHRQIVDLASRCELGTTLIYSYDRALAASFEFHSYPRYPTMGESSMSLLDEAEEKARRLVAETSDDTHAGRAAAISLVAILIHRVRAQRVYSDPQIEQTYEEMLEILRRGYERGISHLYPDGVRAQICLHLGRLVRERGELDRAYKLAWEALTLAENGVMPAPSSFRMRREAQELIAQVDAEPPIVGQEAE